MGEQGAAGERGVYTHRFQDDDDEGADVAALFLGHLGTLRGRTGLARAGWAGRWSGCVQMDWRDG